MKLYEVIKPDAEDLYWRSPKSDDLWALDKLILSKKLGYKCGPAGIDVPNEMQGESFKDLFNEAQSLKRRQAGDDGFMEHSASQKSSTSIPSQ